MKNYSNEDLRGHDLNAVYQQSMIDNYPLPAITDFVSGRTYTYGDLAKRIARVHMFFETAGIRPGDKVALLGKNTPRWIYLYMSCITYGAVVVPILNEFNPVDAANIINHSDSRLLFVSDSIWNHIKDNEFPELKAVISLDAVRMLHCEDIALIRFLRDIQRRFTRRYPNFSRDDIHYRPRENDDMAILNYTSGTTGYSKGVMLSYDNVAGNVGFGLRSRLHFQGSRALSFLPLAHAYGCAFDMLTPLAVGSHVTVLGKAPTPALLLKAMAEVRPNLIVCVPMILEKIYRKTIVPMITKKPMRWILAVPMLDRAIYSRIRAKLVEAFGGQFEEVIIGGAPLNPEVEEFLFRINFPFTVGYGMTECAPLISYTPWREFTPGSAGRLLPCMKGRIQPVDDAPDGQGEIVVKGQNVMLGYYKNPDATLGALDEDGWLHTGDMGYLGGTDNRTVFIRGRYKTMILSANGQNIYPEEIEAKLNNMPYIGESLVLERNGMLVALVYPDEDAVRTHRMTPDDIKAQMSHNLSEVNKLVAPYEQLSAIEVVDKEFEKTPKRSVKRYLYK